ncbi:MAG TPA: ribbon-helix-helix domain-containing protein [Patescibacteria group bacterium]|nr:ribbon-helix-helix domain-containing protein [Patescibacteria group bacterium]
MAPLSVRLPDETRQLLDQAAERTHRSRSFLVKEALERHLADIVHEQSGSGKSRLETLLALKGAGARLYGPRSTEDIDAEVRAFRGDE